MFVELLVHQLNQGHTVDVQARKQISSDTKETSTENPTGRRRP